LQTFILKCELKLETMHIKGHIYHWKAVPLSCKHENLPSNLFTAFRDPTFSDKQ